MKTKICTTNVNDIKKIMTNNTMYIAHKLHTFL